MSFYNPFESNDAGIMGNLQENDLPDFLEEEDEDVQDLPAPPPDPTEADLPELPF